MSKHYKNGKPVPTELTWKEKNPTSYLFRPSKDVKGLIKIANNATEFGVPRRKERK